MFWLIQILDQLKNSFIAKMKKKKKLTVINECFKSWHITLQIQQIENDLWSTNYKSIPSVSKSNHRNLVLKIQ